MLRGTRLRMNANPRRRRCACCQKLFLPEPRSRHCQRFCSQPACRKASKSASQAHWRGKPENRDYWRGPEHVERVRAWRKAHPQYWKPGVHSTESALQDDCRPGALASTTRVFSGCNVSPASLTQCRTAAKAFCASASLRQRITKSPACAARQTGPRSAPSPSPLSPSDGRAG